MLQKNKRILLAGLCIVLVSSAVAGGLYARRQYYKYRPRVVAEGVLFRSRQLSPDVLNQLSSSYGIRTVMNLRDPAEDPSCVRQEEEIVRRQGIGYISMPMTDVVPTEPQLQEFLATIRGGGKPVLIHCREGKVRTGMLAASYRILYDRWSVEQAMQELYRGRRDVRPQEQQRQEAFLRSVAARRQELTSPTK